MRLRRRRLKTSFCGSPKPPVWAISRSCEGSGVMGREGSGGTVECPPAYSDRQRDRVEDPGSASSNLAAGTGFQVELAPLRVARTTCRLVAGASLGDRAGATRRGPAVLRRPGV